MADASDKKTRQQGRAPGPRVKDKWSSAIEKAIGQQAKRAQPANLEERPPGDTASDKYLTKKAAEIVGKMRARARLGRDNLLKNRGSPTGSDWSHLLHFIIDEANRDRRVVVWRVLKKGGLQRDDAAILQALGYESAAEWDCPPLVNLPSNRRASIRWFWDLTHHQRVREQTALLVERLADLTAAQRRAVYLYERYLAREISDQELAKGLDKSGLTVEGLLGKSLNKVLTYEDGLRSKDLIEVRHLDRFSRILRYDNQSKQLALARKKRFDTPWRMVLKRLSELKQSPMRRTKRRQSP